MKTNWRGEPAHICWMCGSTDTTELDPRTRECRNCGNWYGVFPTPDPEENPHERDHQE